MTITVRQHVLYIDGASNNVLQTYGMFWRMKKLNEKMQEFISVCENGNNQL
jgi:hypothetical protein